VKALLDTQTFLWWASDGGARVSERVREILESADTDASLSVVSAWEIAIKVGRGRMELPEPIERYLPDRIRRHRFTMLSVDLPHAIRAGTLPMIHTDPFDRMLVAQAQIEGLPILTADPAIARYDVETIW
jgi:PIN domain nuclease of toxin-antitoxin system